MIDAAIIRTLAAKEKLDPGIIEKDYVLSKALMALSQVDGFQAALIFKGGTALKKCYYRQWRFSEDLDFDCFNLKVCFARDRDGETLWKSNRG